MDNKKNGIPKLRFPGFTGAWEQRKLGDISKTKRGLTYKPSNIDNTGIRVLRSSNIKEDTFVISDNDVFVKESAVNIPFVKNGDILITAANGSTNLVGKHAIIRDIPKNSAVHGGFMLITTSKEYEFLNASMSSNWYKKFIKKYVAGGNGAIGNLRKNDLDNQKIYVPKKDEQEKIGNFFKMLDSLITLHQRKLEHLQEQKKGLLQKMFPKNGENVPEVRFPGFTDAWEQRKLGEMVEKSTIKNSDLEYSKEDILSVATMSDMSFSRDINSTENYMKTYNKILYGEIAFEGHSNKKYRFGRFVLNDYRNGIVSHIYDIYKIIIDYDMNFMKEWISLDRVMYKPLVNSTTSARMMNSLQAKKLYKQKVLLPDLQEQKEIGNFLNKFDTLIALHQRKLDHLELMKKGLLQQMFV